MPPAELSRRRFRRERCARPRFRGSLPFVKVNASKFRVKPGRTWRLQQAPTAIEPLYKSKAHYRKLLARQIEELSELQSMLYANNRYALLLIFQAMDAAGKDSAIKHVMSGVNPQGCEVYSFKQPSAEELDHDFLWRTTRCLPQRGRIGIFNRSYYEEVLIVRVHPEILRAQSLPDEAADEKTIWTDRYRSINDLDLTMPLMDGEETFRRLREIESKAVVVLNTGFIEEERLATMMDAGLAGFVRRPYHPVELIAQIRSILATAARTGQGGPGISPLIPF